MAIFPYFRSIAPTLGVLLGLAIIESCVVHIIAVAIWGWRIALVLSLLDLALVDLLRAIRRLPVAITDGTLTMRLGWLKTIIIPLDQVAGLRGSWDAAALKQKGVANLALAAWPNVMVDLTYPVRLRGQSIHAIAHKLDDPAAFAAAIACA